nr:type I restriction-modification system subunit M N-terminal domain-containing protein [Micromonospora sp. DSM 115978]
MTVSATRPDPPAPTARSSGPTPRNLANVIWQLADLLRGDYKRADYGKVVLPFTVLRRVECVVEQAEPGPPAEFANTTCHTLRSVAAAPPAEAARTLTAYLAGFSDDAREIFERYRFGEQVRRLADARLLPV